MAIVGGALMPLLMGKIADVRHSIAPAYLVPLLAYIVIAFYAFAGAKPKATAHIR
jgi:FHS family L-fucose permease-like MFS transporter